MLVRLRDRRPLPDVFGLEHDIDRIFRGAFGVDFGSPARRARGLEVTGDADGVTVRAEVPGVEPGKISVTVDNRVLTIRGERSSEQRREGVFHLRERATAGFSHSLRLSDDLDAGAITADCHDGVLTVRLARRAAAKPRQVEVTTGSRTRADGAQPKENESHANA